MQVLKKMQTSVLTDCSTQQFSVFGRIPLKINSAWMTKQEAVVAAPAAAANDPSREVGEKTQEVTSSLARLAWGLTLQGYWIAFVSKRRQRLTLKGFLKKFFFT